MNGSKLCKLLRTEPVKERAGVEDGSGKEREKDAFRRDKGALQHPKHNRTDNTEQEPSEKWSQKRKEER